jgi:thiol-disulfide isomerase/thioredoxin
MMRAWFVVFAVVGLASCSGSAPAPSASPKPEASGRLATPAPIQAFQAVDIDGRDISFATWQGKVVVLNVWATWCAPCRREIPMLAGLQETYRDRLLVIGLLQDEVTTAFAREFAKTSRLNYPIVRTTFEIESRFPPVLMLPSTYVIDAAGRLVAMYVGELDPVVLKKDLEATFGRVP